MLHDPFPRNGKASDGSLANARRVEVVGFSYYSLFDFRHVGGPNRWGYDEYGRGTNPDRERILSIILLPVLEYEYT